MLYWSCAFSSQRGHGLLFSTSPFLSHGWMLLQHLWALPNSVCIVWLFRSGEGMRCVQEVGSCLPFKWKSYSLRPGAEFVTGTRFCSVAVTGPALRSAERQIQTIALPRNSDVQGCGVPAEAASRLVRERCCGAAKNPLWSLCKFCMAYDQRLLLPSNTLQCLRTGIALAPF